MKRIDQLIKPKGSLGVLENIAIQLSGIQGQFNQVFIRNNYCIGGR